MSLYHRATDLTPHRLTRRGQLRRGKVGLTIFALAQGLFVCRGLSSFVLTKGVERERTSISLGLLICFLTCPPCDLSDVVAIDFEPGYEVLQYTAVGDRFNI